MTNRHLAKPIAHIFVVYALCFAVRLFEYFVLRTDQTIFGEAFVHKLLGIGVLVLTAKMYGLTLADVGFSNKDILRQIAWGLGLGAIAFIPAYATEFLILQAQNAAPSLGFYVTSYAIDGNQGSQLGLIFFAFCIVGNLINVVMEEGVFRGLFLRLAQAQMGFGGAVVLSSALFGFWHVVAPLRNLIDGASSPTGALLYALMLFCTTAVTGAKFCLLVRVSGSLWMPMADHFFNNTIINLLHVTTASGADALQVMRISIAQTLSFLIVLALYFKMGAHKKESFR